MNDGKGGDVLWPRDSGKLVIRDSHPTIKNAKSNQAI